MKKGLACVLFGAMLLGSIAMAEGLEERIDHLKSHAPRTVFACVGDQVKLRVAPNAKKMHGRMRQGEQFMLLDTFGEWLQVEVVQATPDNPNSSRGMTGWVHVDQVACPCDLAAMQEAE